MNIKNTRGYIRVCLINNWVVREIIACRRYLDAVSIVPFKMQVNNENGIRMGIAG
jgi:hypothetical protein